MRHMPMQAAEVQQLQMVTWRALALALEDGSRHVSTTVYRPAYFPGSGSACRERENSKMA